MISKIESEDDWKAASERVDQLHRRMDELTEAEAEECDVLMASMSAWNSDPKAGVVIITDSHDFQIIRIEDTPEDFIDGIENEIRKDHVK